MRRNVVIAVAVLAAAGLAISVLHLEAQCVPYGTAVYTSIAGQVTVFKNLPPGAGCSLVATNNANVCYPLAASMAPASYLMAVAATGATSPSCSWNCFCVPASGAVTIDSSDGLPVELMAFSVE